MTEKGRRLRFIRVILPVKMDDILYQGNELDFTLVHNGTLAGSFQKEPTALHNFPWSPQNYLREEIWAIPLMAAAALNIVIIIIFEVFIVVKAFQGTPSRRHFFLGQCLIAGLIMMSVSGFTFALQPSYFSCASSRAMIGVSPALVFGALFVKCVFLISLHSGVYLPAYYQGLLLFFIVLVQGAITIQWMATHPTRTKLAGMATTNEIYWSCESSYKNYIISLMYVMILVLMVAVFSIKCRRVRENFRESSYIGFSLCIIVPMWLVWIFTGFALSPKVQPACLGFGSVVTATIVFLIMFIPKARQMVAVGKDGYFAEDRESSLSSNSDDKYSPSFLMFRPIKSSKQGIMSSKMNNCSIYKTGISDSIRMPGDDDGIYATISPKNDLGISSNPNFYLFSSHSNIEMMY